jgi:glycosyltransferase involved in cell wall biosynthesis
MCGRFQTCGRNMQILHLVDSGGMGGIERHIEVLCEAQRAQGLDARVLLIDAYEKNIWPTRLFARAIPYAHAGGARRLASALRSARPALVHTHGYKAGILGRLVCRVLRIPVVSAFHAGEIGAFPVSLYQRLDLLTSPLAPRIAVSAGIAAQLPKPAHLVQNFAPASTVDIAAPLPNVIAFVGRLSVEKGPDLFCMLAAAAQKEQHRWVIYGDGPMRQELDAKYGDCVTFCGMVSEMESEWPNIGLLVMTSRAEGLPYAALEALSHGVPLLAHAVGGLPDLLGGAPDWLLPQGDLDVAQARIAAWDCAKRDGSQALRQRALNLLAGDYCAQAALPRLFAAYADAGVMV